MSCAKSARKRIAVANLRPRGQTGTGSVSGRVRCRAGHPVFPGAPCSVASSCALSIASSTTPDGEPGCDRLEQGSVCDATLRFADDPDSGIVEDPDDDAKTLRVGRPAPAAAAPCGPYMRVLPVGRFGRRPERERGRRFGEPVSRFRRHVPVVRIHTTAVRIVSSAFGEHVPALERGVESIRRPAQRDRMRVAGDRRGVARLRRPGPADQKGVERDPSTRRPGGRGRASPGVLAIGSRPSAARGGRMPSETLGKSRHATFRSRLRELCSGGRDRRRASTKERRHL